MKSKQKKTNQPEKILESKTLSIIDTLYQKEEERKAQESTFTPINVSLDAADVAMLTTIAKRFNESRDLLARDALNSAIRDMFSKLRADERKLLAREADELTNSIAAEIASDNGFEHDGKDSTWVTEDRNVTKAEKKLAKLKEKEQKDTVPDSETNESAESGMTETLEQEESTSNPTESANEEQADKVAVEMNTEHNSEETQEEEKTTNSIFG